MRSVKMLQVAATFSFIAPLVAILTTLIIRRNVPDLPARFTAMGIALSLTLLAGLSLSILVLSNRTLVQGTSALTRAAFGAAANGVLLVILGLSSF